MRHSIRTLVVPLLLICSACGPKPPAQDVKTPSHAIAPLHTVSPASPRRLRIGEQLVLQFDASPASGYSWSFAGPLPPILRMERDPAQVPPEVPRDATVQTWTFRAEHAGRARLSFVYGHPWRARYAPPVYREFDVQVE
ncbi:protease inhibitor I42 family protein [Lysobacter sp. FW306-1B-D06B]|uniref:protease inhibitor I42 family protein n=1 Tax=Lysobacter sp. FW306-1B-D06B TaxID=3140250 RepID=UPI0031405411